jgi:hypothetical protein
MQQPLAVSKMEIIQFVGYNVLEKVFNCGSCNRINFQQLSASYLD